MALPELARNKEGRELQFATNFVGHFALTLGLHPWLKAANGARVISVSSTGSLWSPILWDDPDFRFIPYHPFVGYGQSKTACILVSVGIAANGASTTSLRTHSILAPLPPIFSVTREVSRRPSPTGRHRSRGPRRLFCWPHRRSLKALQGAILTIATKPRSSMSAASNPSERLQAMRSIRATPTGFGPWRKR
jgi:hypothetical protein